MIGHDHSSLFFLKNKSELVGSNSGGEYNGKQSRISSRSSS